MATPDIAADVLAHRAWLRSFVPVRGTGSVVDLGCGEGRDVAALAHTHGDASVRLIGLDVSEKKLAIAQERSRDDQRITFVHHDLNKTLPLESATIDVVFTSNLLECVAQQSHCVSEIARIVRPGGTVVAAHWDWDSQMFDGSDKDRIRGLIHAFADWQQPWMAHADGWMGRRLWGLFASSGLFDGAVHARALINTAFQSPCYGHARAQEFQFLVEHALASSEDVSWFLDEQAELSRQGRYFYCITGLAYVGTRCR